MLGITGMLTVIEIDMRAVAPLPLDMIPDHWPDPKAAQASSHCHEHPCLALDQQHRYQSGSLIRDNLNHMLTHETLCSVSQPTGDAKNV